jgi:hypothetical protein
VKFLDLVFCGLQVVESIMFRVQGMVDVFLFQRFGVDTCMQQLDIVVRYLRDSADDGRPIDDLSASCFFSDGSLSSANPAAFFRTKPEVQIGEWAMNSNHTIIEPK